MKFFLKLITLGSLLTSIGACSSEETTIPSPEIEIPSVNEDIKHNANAKMPDLTFTTASRTEANIIDGVFTPVWAFEDAIGILAAKEHIPTGQWPSQVNLYITKETAGKAQAIFMGNGWSFTPGNKYLAYFPRQEKSEWKSYNLTVNYTGQCYNHISAEKIDLGKADYMIAQATKPTDSRINFDFKRVGCLIQMHVNMPKAGMKLTKVELIDESANAKVEKPFLLEGIVAMDQNLAEGDSYAISPTVSSNRFSVDVRGVAPTTKDNEDVIIYFMMPPTQLKDKGIKIELTVEDQAQPINTYSLITQDFIAGKGFRIRTQPVNENTFYVYEPGTLQLLVGTKKPDKLIVMGKINGDDIQFIRSIAGAAPMPGDAPSGQPDQLREVNLYNASIVEGGKNGYVTVNNTVSEGMFKGCKFDKLVLPLNLTHICAETFAGTVNLHQLALFNQLQQVGANAFNDMHLGILQVYAHPHDASNTPTLHPDCLGNIKGSGSLEIQLTNEWNSPSTTNEDKAWYTGITPNFILEISDITVNGWNEGGQISGGEAEEEII